MGAENSNRKLPKEPSFRRSHSPIFHTEFAPSLESATSGAPGNVVVAWLGACLSSFDAEDPPEPPCDTAGSSDPGRPGASVSNSVHSNMFVILLAWLIE